MDLALSDLSPPYATYQLLTGLGEEKSRSSHPAPRQVGKVQPWLPVQSNSVDGSWLLNMYRALEITSEDEALESMSESMSSSRDAGTGEYLSEVHETHDIVGTGADLTTSAPEKRDRRVGT